MKLAVIGGGSTYTPELVDGIGRLRRPGRVTELVLVDPDQDRLAVVGPVSARIMAAYGHPAGVRWTTNLDDGARRRGRGPAPAPDRRPGGPAARRDLAARVRLHRPGDHRGRRVRQGAADRAGRARSSPNGSAPRASPDAWIIDFTNPVGIVTRALLDAGHRAVGLCNVAIGFQRDLRRACSASTPERVVLEHVGLNHLTWERAVLLDGADVLPGPARRARRTRSRRT